MTTPEQAAPQGENKAEKLSATTLRVRFQNDDRSAIEGETVLFLKKLTPDFAFFANDTRVAFVKTKGAVEIQDPANKEAPETPRNVYARLYGKDGANGPFLSGYAAGIAEAKPYLDKDGVVHKQLEVTTPIVDGENGPEGDFVSATANIKGPHAAQILAMMPKVEKKSSAPRP